MQYLKDPVRDKVIFHILENARSKGIYIDHINGYYDHLHAIVSLGATQTLADVMQKIKGESSFWINKNKLTSLRFEWQDDYWSVSVGADHIDRLRRYIRNQAEHHKTESLEDEIRRLGFDYQEDDIKD